MQHPFGLSCRDITRLVSESMDHSLPLTQRIKIRIHLMMCKYCARFEKQMQFIRLVCRKEEKPTSDAVLPDDARERIRRTLASAGKG